MTKYRIEAEVTATVVMEIEARDMEHAGRVLDERLTLSADLSDYECVVIEDTITEIASTVIGGIEE